MDGALIDAARFVSSLGLMKSVFFAACLLPLMALANGGGYITGVESTGAFQPIGIEQVEMLSERLEIDLHIEYADIRIEYVLHNPGKKVKVEAAFPSAIWERQEYGKEAPAKSTVDLKNFSLIADGKAVAVSRISDDLKVSTPSFYSGNVVNSWHKFKLDFAAGQTRRVQVSYRNPYHAHFSSVSDNASYGAPSLTYLFSSAAAWAGSIRQGTVIVRAVSVPKKQISLSHPSRFQSTDNGWIWSFTDFEPTVEDDLIIKTRPSYEAFIAGYLTENGEEVPRGDYWCENADFDQNTNEYTGKWTFARKDFQSSATSHLPPVGDHVYVPGNVRGYGRSSAWVEGVPGDGVGESLTLTLEKPAKIASLALVNGYATSEALYYANGRAEELEVSVNGGKPFTVQIPDEYLATEYFYVDLPASKELVKTVKLTLAKVRPGSKYQDTAITKVVLLQPLAKAPKITPAR